MLPGRPEIWSFIHTLVGWPVVIRGKSLKVVGGGVIRAHTICQPQSRALSSEGRPVPQNLVRFACLKPSFPKGFEGFQQIRGSQTLKERRASRAKTYIFLRVFKVSRKPEGPKAKKKARFARRNLHFPKGFHWFWLKGGPQTPKRTGALRVPKPSFS